MCFYSATFEVMTEDLQLTRSVLSSVLSNLTGRFVDNR